MKIEIKRNHTREEWISFVIHLMQIVLVLIIAIGLVSSTYAGETYTNDFNYEIINCSIENNSSNLIGLNLTWNGSIATIETQINYYPDNFTLSCWVNQSYEVKKVSRGGWTRPKNITNQSQQENISSEILSNFSNLPPLINVTYETNKTDTETKSFFEPVFSFIKEHWIILMVGMIFCIASIFIILYFYNLRGENF